jgi:hypothetical protein
VLRARGCSMSRVRSLAWTGRGRTARNLSSLTRKSAIQSSLGLLRTILTGALGCFSCSGPGCGMEKEQRCDGWNDSDVKREIISISRSREEGEDNAPKTAGSTREIPIPWVVDLLKQLPRRLHSDDGE